MNTNIASNGLLTAEALRNHVKTVAKKHEEHERRSEENYKTQLAQAVRRGRRTIKGVFERDWAPHLLTVAADGEFTNTLFLIGTRRRNEKTLDVKNEARLICGTDLLKKMGYGVQRVERAHSGDFVDVSIKVDWSSKN